MRVGVSIIDDPSRSGDGLPVMDVPVFVGFAARGPWQRPVAVEDMVQFEAFFGLAMELVRADTPSGAERLMAHLHASVAGFFANGGRRCFVIRVAARAGQDWVDAGAAAPAGAGASSARFEFAGLRLALRGELATLAGQPGWLPADSSAWYWSNTDFQLRAASPGVWADRFESAVRLRAEAVHPSDALREGDLLRAREVTAAGISSRPGWLRVDRAGTVAEVLAGSRTADWLWPGGGEGVVTAAAWLLERVRVDLALRQEGAATRIREACGLSAGAGNLPWFEGDIDAAFDAADAAGLTLRAPDWPLAGTHWHTAGHTAGFTATGPDWLLLPLGVGDDFGVWRAAQLDGRDALARNGLDRFDASLFIDPAWNDRLRGQELRRWADDIRFLGTGPRRLRGLHGAFGRDDACAREATWIVVPDAVQPGWARTEPLPTREGVVRAVADPACHCPPRDFENCEPPPPQPPQVPVIDFGIAAPVALPADVVWLLKLLPEPLALPAPDAPPPSRIEVQIASQPDFSDACGLTDGLPPATLALTRPSGVYFLRARAHRLGLSSGWSAAFTLDVRAVGWRGLPVGLLPLHDPATGVCAQVQRALIDLCAASREHFALLSVPSAWDEPTLAAHVTALRAHAQTGDASDAAASASFAAVYHPWVLQRDADARLREHPPEGLLMGLMARRGRLKGAWSAPGLEALGGALQLSGQLTEAARIEALGANPLELRSAGISATRANTLSDDADWASLGVRRLMILLRRLARREGERFAFEPNDLALRRSLERTFDELLRRLLQRGAFRGADAASAYLLRTASGAAAAREIERGECSLLIQVAPSRPLRFLTLHLLRAGEALQIEER